MTGPRDYYEVLGVDRKASQEAIRKAFRGLARELHPDVNKAPDAGKRFAEVQEAYDVLSDEEKRRMYDRFGHVGVGAQRGTGAGTGTGTGAQAGGPRAYSWSSSQSGGAGPDLGSIFEEIFGSGGRAGPFGARHQEPTPREGSDTHHELQIAFMTAIHGGKETIRLSGSDGREIEVTIPSGIGSGEKLRVPKLGEPGRDGTPAGDLILTVRVGKHPYFKRERLDLLIDVPVTIAEATLGCTVEMPLPDEGTISLKVPAGTSSGSRLRVKGKGIARPGGDVGDFYAVIHIVTPTELDRPTRELVEQLGKRLENPRSSPPWTDDSGGG